MSSLLHLTQPLSHGGSYCTLGNELCHWGTITLPGRIMNRMYPKKLVVLVSAKRNRLYCRGCLGRPLGQLKLSEDCDRRPVMQSSDRRREWKDKEMTSGTKAKYRERKVYSVFGVRDKVMHSLK